LARKHTNAASSTSRQSCSTARQLKILNMRPASLRYPGIPLDGFIFLQVKARSLLEVIVSIVLRDHRSGRVLTFFTSAVGPPAAPWGVAGWSVGTARTPGHQSRAGRPGPFRVKRRQDASEPGGPLCLRNRT